MIAFCKTNHCYIWRTNEQQWLLNREDVDILQSPCSQISETSYRTFWADIAPFRSPQPGLQSTVSVRLCKLIQTRYCQVCCPRCWSPKSKTTNANCGCVLVKTRTLNTDPWLHKVDRIELGWLLDLVASRSDPMNASNVGRVLPDKPSFVDPMDVKNAGRVMNSPAPKPVMNYGHLVETNSRWAFFHNLQWSTNIRCTKVADCVD